LYYVGLPPEPKYYGADYMSTEVRTQILKMYDSEKIKVLQYERITIILYGQC
jgi:hypothetical protein